MVQVFDRSYKACLIGLLVWIIGSTTNPVKAARPFVTDDARLTQAHSCQVESWSRRYKSSTEFWALPACNPFGNLEFTLGTGRAFYDQFDTTDYVVQAKTLFKEISPGGIGWGIAVGKIAHPAVNPGPNLLGNQYAYFPISLATLDTRQVVHINLGALRDRAKAETRGTWGFGLEHNQTDRIQLIAETFGDHVSSPYFQIGVRYAAIRNLLQIDTTLGGQSSGLASGRWFSIGLRLTPESIFRSPSN